MQQGTGKCEIEFETKLWQETGRPFLSQALSKGIIIKKVKRVCGRRPAGRFCLKHCQKRNKPLRHKF
jgi:hypothetical protein